jgi:hypothetical protein
MGLFGAGAFSPEAIMNAASIINGGGIEDPMRKRQREKDRATGLASPSLGADIKSLFYHILGQPYGGSLQVPLSGPQQLQLPQGQGLMSLFGG